MFAAISGLRNHQTMLDVTANDIANVNTIGYKSARATFKEALSQLQRGGAAPTAQQGGANAAQVGLGVNLSSIDNMMQGGAFQSTGNVLDVAIQGESFFTLSADAGLTGQRAYTRAGNFTANAAGDLVTQDGWYVVGYGAQGAPPTQTPNLGVQTRINIPGGATGLNIGQDGAVSYVDSATGNRTVAGYLQLAKFSNASGLERASSNRWFQSGNSGIVAPGIPGPNQGLTVSGVVEMSNVDLANSFTGMITAQRGFQANSRIISTSDEMLQELVNLKR
jgi:flagellar hook protein FlgE